MQIGDVVELVAPNGSTVKGLVKLVRERDGGRPPALNVMFLSPHEGDTGADGRLAAHALNLLPESETPRAGETLRYRIPAS